MTSTSCAPGTIATGQSCFENAGLRATIHNPVCLDNSDFPAFPDGYCSEFCDTATQNCPAGNVCYGGLNISKSGVCLQSCTSDADCRTTDGYACVSRGLSTNVCSIAPEIPSEDDYVDNDFNNLMDRADPNCQTLPGLRARHEGGGQPCTLHGQCTASVGLNNPFCIDENDERTTTRATARTVRDPNGRRTTVAPATCTCSTRNLFPVAYARLHGELHRGLAVPGVADGYSCLEQRLRLLLMRRLAAILSFAALSGCVAPLADAPLVAPPPPARELRSLAPAPRPGLGRGELALGDGARLGVDPRGAGRLPPPLPWIAAARPASCFP